MNSRPRWIALFLAALFAVVAPLGCVPQDARGPTDESTMAVLGTVRALHHQADVYESSGDFERASQAIRRVLAIEYPRGMVESEDLKVDAYGRLAELALRRGNADDALSLSRTGLVEGRRDTVFRARLLMVRGQCLGALADRARVSGDTAGGDRLRAEAIQSLEESIAMNQRVLGRILDGGAR